MEQGEARNYLASSSGSKPDDKPDDAHVWGVSDVVNTQPFWPCIDYYLGSETFVAGSYDSNFSVLEQSVGICSKCDCHRHMPLAMPVL